MAMPEKGDTLKIFSIGLYIGGILLASCASELQSMNDATILMPYFDGINNNYSYGEFGYINAETFEIVIPAQYDRAGPFIGDFAWVTKWNEDRKAAKYYDDYFIINKNNKIILGKFDRVMLFEAGDKNHVFAITGKYRHSQPFDLHTSTQHQLYNLSTGKRLLSKTYSGSQKDHEPKIELFSHYLQFENDLYEIQENGQLKKISKTVAAELIAKEKQTQELDIGQAVQNLPEGFRLNIWHGLNTWDMGDNWFETVKDIYKIEWPISRTRARLYQSRLYYQIDYKIRQYQIFLVDKTGEEFVGLYDALQDTWPIPPIKMEYYENSDILFDFHYTGYNDWMCYYKDLGGWDFPHFYNIKTGKRYQNLYGMNDKGIMTYMGYTDESSHYYHSEFIEEEFR
jgi:hypothetical protein